MKYIIHGTLLIIALFFLSASDGFAAVTDLKAELESYERVRLSTPNSDGIAFYVKVTNTGSETVRNFFITSRIPNSTEYGPDGIFEGRLIEMLDPGQSTVVELGYYTIERSKRLKGKIEFTFGDEYLSTIKMFKTNKAFSFPIDSMKLGSSADEGRNRIDIKSVSGGSSKKISSGAKEVKLLSISIKSAANTDLVNPGFSYMLLDAYDAGRNELKNITLWSGKENLCGPISQEYITFTNCSIPIKKGKSQTITLKADISSDMTKDMERRISFSSYSFSGESGEDIFTTKLKPKILKFK